MEKFTFENPSKLKMLSDEQITTIHEKALYILEHTGVHFETPKALEVLAEGGATVDFESKTVKFPPQMVIDAINKAPGSFQLYNRDGEPTVTIGDGHVNYDPGSSGVRFLESDGVTARDATRDDMVKISQVTEAMKNISLLSSALTPYDIPQNVGDSYRVYTMLKHSTKPFITGAISVKGIKDIIDLLEAAAGGPENLKAKPRAILDITAIAPLRWTEISCSNILDAASYGIPVELLSVPLIGASAPATLAGCVLLHTVEVLSGLVLTQLVNPGNPTVYGGAPMYFDMKNLTTSLNSIETNMIGAAYSQMGKYYGMPVHTYACLSDSKMNDSQAGLETAISGTVALMAGVNVISGVGMLDFCNTFSLEKLVIDNEICGMAQRLGRGIEFSDETLAADLIDEMGTYGEYLATKHTRKWYRKEPYMPSEVIDRRNIDDWKNKGSKSSFENAKEIVADILANPRAPKLSDEISDALDNAWRKIAIADGELDEAGIKETFV